MEILIPEVEAPIEFLTTPINQETQTLKKEGA
jgi:hypothetical protein